MSVCVIACYRPLPGKERELRVAVQDHIDVLRTEGLVTERQPIVMRAADGTIVEVFEWSSQQAIEAAHDNVAVLALWKRFESVCTYERLGQLAEANQLFSAFEPV
jgi:hypothetical protein